MSFPVFDLHCDTAFLLQENPQEGLYSNGLHIDLKRAGELPGYAQCFACFTSSANKGDPLQIFDREYRAITRELEQNADKICLATSASQIKENQQSGIMSAILTIEGTSGIGCDPQNLEHLYNDGFRMISLGWNEKNILTGSHLTGGGLTDLGKIFLQEAQRLGFIVDVSHISDEGFWDILELTQRPIVASHSNSRWMRNVSRNLTDDMFLAICQTGGAAGINLYADFLADQPTVDSVCQHIEHYLSLDPSGKHICLGSDMDGCDRLPTGFEGVQDYPKLARSLLDSGLAACTVEDIFWNNALGVMERCCI